MSDVCNPGQVFILDDHPSVRLALSQLVESLGWTVCAQAGSLARAREYLKPENLSWTVLVADLHLPDGDGLSFVSEVRSLGYSQPILVHSVASDEEMALKAFKAGANGYLSKISDTDEFELALRRIAKGQKYVHPDYAHALIEASVAGIASADPFSTLSEREVQVFDLWARGSSSKEIARILDCSANTVPTFKRRILKKLKLNSYNELVRYAVSKGIDLN